jgi:hypothetical protein
VVWINATQGFRSVAGELWAFRIGGYQVLDKYLKDANSLSREGVEQRLKRRTARALGLLIQRNSR